MNNIIETTLLLNSHMVLADMSGSFEIGLSSEDFDRFQLFLFGKFELGFVHHLPGRHGASYFKVAGPGGYITFRRLNKDEK